MQERGLVQVQGPVQERGPVQVQDLVQERVLEPEMEQIQEEEEHDRPAIQAIVLLHAAP
ncbi:MAG TPA: hypothetical protein PLI09_23325 [Candidatus Hydrogenedentes bacterium]|nr:hypothetical protein [Candidatus Hydrogenedentota bacterium]